MMNSESGTSNPLGTANRISIQRLLFVADAAVADVDELPPGVRAVIDAAGEVYVITPTLPRQQGQAFAQRIGQSLPGPGRSRPLANRHDAGSDQVRTVARSDQRYHARLARAMLAAHDRGAA
jgi:hypothetical protein